MSLLTDHDIRLAMPRDARCIAEMARDLVEYGLGWRWRPNRVLRSIRNLETSVAVAEVADQVVGFGIMNYKEDEAHLLLLAVQASHRRRGIGTAIMSWLEATALTAGIGLIYLESRTKNVEARAFYQELGYKEIKVIRGYYRGSEDCIRIGKDLWSHN